MMLDRYCQEKKISPVFFSTIGKIIKKIVSSFKKRRQDLP
jgi:hypothetical protein